MAQKQITQPSTTRITDSGLFWFNLLAAGPWVLSILYVLIDPQDAGGYGFGAALIGLFFAPVALPVLAIDLYRLGKRLIHWINTGNF